MYDRLEGDPELFQREVKLAARLEVLLLGSSLVKIVVRSVVALVEGFRNTLRDVIWRTRLDQEVVSPRIIDCSKRGLEVRLPGKNDSGHAGIISTNNRQK